MMIKRQITLATFILTMHFASPMLFCQSLDFQFNNLSTLDGLSNNTVEAVLEDSRGFIWIATSDGLNRYNGYEFDIFKYESGNPNSLPNNFILCLAEDSLKNIWIGTNQSGLARYNLSEEKFYRYSHIPADESSIPGTVVRTIFVDRRNGIWIGTDSGLAKYDPATDSFIPYFFPMNETARMSTADVRNIFQENDSDLLIKCSIGLYRLSLDNDNIYKIEYASGKVNDALNTNESILIDSQERLWIGSDEGLLCYKQNTGSLSVYKRNEKDPKSISSNRFSVLFEDSQKRIWIGTENNGINLYDPAEDNFIVYRSANFSGNSIANNIISDISEDSYGNIWISTQEGGVSIAGRNSNLFQHFSHDPAEKKSISSNKVSSFYEDELGRIWIGTGDGKLNMLRNDNEFIKYTLESDMIAPSILGITGSNRNSLFITGWGLGLQEFSMQSESFTDLMVKDLGSNPSFSKNMKGLGTDSHGNIWLASHSDKGVTVYSQAEDRFYNASFPGPFNQDLLNSPFAVSMMEDSRNRIWIISYTGIYMYDSIFHSFKNIPDDPGTIGSNYNFTMYEDRNGTLWVGNSNGLDRIRFGESSISFERVSEHYPIPNNIKGILEDNRGNLWLSSNLELTRFNPGTKQIKHFRINQELPSQEFFERSCLKSSSGQMYFGGTSGFFRFQPDSIGENSQDIRVYITGLLLFNERQTPGGEQSPLSASIMDTRQIILNHDQNMISFEYAALNFNQYRTIEYTYRLDGFDDKWYHVGEKRSVSYTNLPPGEYTFMVKILEGNEISEKPGAEINLKIRPPFWMTGIAYTIYAIIFLALLYLFRTAILNREKLKNELKLEKINIRNVRETNLMKLRFFTNISHEFRTPLTLIKAPVDKLITSGSELGSEEQLYHLNLIQKNSERLLKMVNQLMDYRKFEAGSLVLEASEGDIIDFCRQTWGNFSFHADQKQISYIFNADPQSLLMTFDPDKMDKILSNLLSNAFKYTEKYGKISMNIGISKQIDSVGGHDQKILEIRIKDSGIGISPKDLPRIFDRFYSVTRKGPEKLAGTGIGLTLAKELTELHGGMITVHSEEREGTEFLISFPLIKNKLKQTIEEDHMESGSSESGQKGFAETAIDSRLDSEQSESTLKYKILLIEDDDDLRNLLDFELRQSYQTLVAKNGEAGLRKAYFDIPDLVLSDVMMPGMDGFELCRTLKSDERTSHLPVILLTARHSQEKQLEGFDAGADDYIFKPFNIDVLKARIKSLLSARQEMIDKFREGTSLYFNDEGIIDKDRQLIQSIIDIVLENITNENINAEFISEKLHISRSLIYLKIEAIARQTVNEFIRNIRLKKSVRLLSSGNMTITEIAYAVGFSSQSYYTRSFTKLYGLPPKEYVKKEKS